MKNCHTETLLLGSLIGTGFTPRYSWKGRYEGCEEDLPKLQLLQLGSCRQVQSSKSGRRHKSNHLALGISTGRTSAWTKTCTVNHVTLHPRAKIYLYLSTSIEFNCILSLFTYHLQKSVLVVLVCQRPAKQAPTRMPSAPTGPTELCRAPEIDSRLQQLLG